MKKWEILPEPQPKEKDMKDLVFTVYGEVFSHDEAEGRFTHASVDKDGSLFIYKDEPTQNNRVDESERNHWGGIRFLRIRGGFLLPEGDWRTSVRKIEYAVIE